MRSYINGYFYTMKNIIRKSEIAKLTTNKLAGVRRLAVDIKMEITTKLPAKATIVKMTITKPRYQT